MQLGGFWSVSLVCALSGENISIKIGTYGGALREKILLLIIIITPLEQVLP